MSLMCCQQKELEMQLIFKRMDSTFLGIQSYSKVLSLKLEMHTQKA